MSRDGRDDAADIDRAFADIMSRWDQTAQRTGDVAPPGTAEGDDATDPSIDPTPEAPTSSTPEAPTQPTPDASPARAAEPVAAPHDEPAPRPRTIEEVFGTNPDTGWRVHTPPPEDDDFVPPRPTPPSSNDVTFWLALAGIVGGPLWIIYLALAAPYSSRLWFALAVGATLCGFGLMIMRLPARHDPEADDGDDGAVV